MSKFLRLAAVVVVVGAFVAGFSNPASGFTTKTVTITKETPVTVKLGPIAGNYPGGTAAVPTPSGCGNADNTAPFQATCDRVPLKIVTPSDLGPTDDFLVTISVSWDPADEVDEGTGVNDLDVYLYDNQQIGKRTSSTSTTFTRLAVSATGSQPEVIKLFSPDLVDYNLVVINFAGPNLSYTVKADLKVDSFESPFEDLGPSFAPRTRSSATASKSDTSDSFVAPIDRSGDDPPSTGGFSGGASSFGGESLGDVGDILSGGRNLDEVPILPDSDFASLDGATTTDSFSAPTLPEGSGRSRLAGAVGPVSGILVAFWLVLVPIALLAGGVFLLLRRSRNAFSFS